MYTAGKDGCIIKWDLYTGKKLHTFYKIRPPKDPSGKGKGKARAEPENVEGHTDEIWALAMSPDGRLLASGGKDRRVGVWDVDKNEWVKGFSGHRDSISVRVIVYHAHFLTLIPNTSRHWHSVKALLLQRLPLHHSFTQDHTTEP